MAKSVKSGWFALGLVLAAASGGCSSTGEVMTAPDVETATPTPAPMVLSNVPTGTGTYDSNLPDYAFNVRDVMARYEPPTFDGSAFTSTLTIELVESAGRCSEFAAGVIRRGAKTVTLQIHRTGATANDAAMKQATYTIGAAKTGDVLFARNLLSETCTPSTLAMPFDAAVDCFDMIDVKMFDGKRVVGDYSLRTSDGRFVTGTFDAALCDAKAPSAPTTCE